MKVRELMTPEIATVRPEDGLDQAARSMEERDCGCVVVVDEESRLAGILTDRDVCLAALHTERTLSRIRVADVMTVEVFTCGPEQSVAEAEHLMGRHQVRRLPVVDERGSLLGILSLDDIALEACLEEDLIVPPVSTRAVGRTLGQISRTHLVKKG